MGAARRHGVSASPGADAISDAAQTIRRHARTAFTAAGMCLFRFPPDPVQEPDAPQMATVMYWHRRLRVPASPLTCSTNASATLQGLSVFLGAG
jgi:hypothetical protein